MNLAYIYLSIIFFTKILFAQVTMTVLSDLAFPDQAPQVSSDIVITPQDPGAALILVTGGPANKAVSCSFQRTSVIVSIPPNANTSQRITVRNYTLQCPAAFDASGQLQIKVGATAQKRAADIPGQYESITDQEIRVTY